jgi:hypothetical protein
MKSNTLVKLTSAELEGLYKKIKDGQAGARDTKIIFGQIEERRKQFDKSHDSEMSNEEENKRLQKFFAVWNQKRKTLKLELDDIDDSDEEVPVLSMNKQVLSAKQDQKFVDYEWDDQFRIQERDVIDEIKGEKLEVIQRLNFIKDLQLKESMLHSLHSEKLQTIDDLLGDTLKTRKETNKELQKAYMASTKATTTNAKTGLIATGGILGTLGLPGIGTIGGALVGWGIGRKIEEKVIDKTERNFKKMERDV